jgi:hypothetical protein
MLTKISLAILFVATLALSSVGLGTRSASAEVLMNDWLPLAFALDNPCEAGTSPIAFQGKVHHVWYTTPEGGLKMNIQAHLIGVDSDGTEYVLNFQRHMEHFAYFDPLGNLFPFDDVFANTLVSKGSTVNAQIVITFTQSTSLNPAGNPNAVTVVACRGEAE